MRWPSKGVRDRLKRIWYVFGGWGLLSSIQGTEYKHLYDCERGWWSLRPFGRDSTVKLELA